MSERQWVTYVLPWARHVEGRHTVRTFDEAGVPEEQLYEVRCAVCMARWGPVKCNTGMVRHHIAKFALTHLHRKPLDPAA